MFFGGVGVIPPSVVVAGKFGRVPFKRDPGYVLLIGAIYLGRLRFFLYESDRSDHAKTCLRRGSGLFGKSDQITSAQLTSNELGVHYGPLTIGTASLAKELPYLGPPCAANST